MNKFSTVALDFFADHADSAALVRVLGRVAVVYGGTSAERDISLQSGQAVIGALQAEGVDVVGVDIRQNPIAQLQAIKADRVFIALHGPGGEDGRMQALLEYLQLPYTGSGVSASALCMDKQRTKQVWQASGLPTPDYAVLTATTDWATVFAQLGPEIIVKPIHEGSSIGMARVSSVEGLQQAFDQAHQFDKGVIAERFIQGPEFTIALLNGVTLPPIGLKPAEAFYDYHAKYLAEDTQYLCPCGLSFEDETRLKTLAAQAFSAVGAEGWGRVDVMADTAGNFYLLEVNTVPGMTSHSLVPMAAKAAGLTFNQLVLAITSQTLP
ncbi:MAG: D-alanine--D-alanine ligase [Sphingobacteriales bacterium]|jgi:D-alanine-D-alanine ligase|nr:MAG: D-alanine--D-alanine ligase [Sphingobacteriales bacterium]